MQGFEKYTAEMATFEKSKLYIDYYFIIIKLILLYAPIHSAEIERRLSIKGTQVRKLIQHARRKGHAICSSEAGYYKAKNYKELEKGLQHLFERRNSIDFTLHKLFSSAYPGQQQTTLKLEAI